MLPAGLLNVEYILVSTHVSGLENHDLYETPAYTLEAKGLLQHARNCGYRGRFQEVCIRQVHHGRIVTIDHDRRKVILAKSCLVRRTRSSGYCLQGN